MRKRGRKEEFSIAFGEKEKELVFMAFWWVLGKENGSRLKLRNTSQRNRFPVMAYFNSELG